MDRSFHDKSTPSYFDDQIFEIINEFFGRGSSIEAIEIVNVVILIVKKSSRDHNAVVEIVI